MMLSRNHRNNNSSISRYLTIPSRLNETTISADRNMNRFTKKVIVQKDKELEEKTKEIDEITKKYEDKIKELNISRNEDREKFEKQLQTFKIVKPNRRPFRGNTTRAKTPVSFID